MSSDALLERAKGGETTAWNELYRSLAPAVAGYLRLRGARDVDDLTSETFVAVFRNIATFDGSLAQFRSWVFVIAHRRLLDERRRHARHPAPVPLADTFTTEDDVDGAMSEQRVRALCAQLPTDQADVLVLRILGDFTIEQIAEVIGKSAGAVKQLQRRGLDNLRKISPEQAVPL
jgi:RNA polymerase sigma-70 factor (ECF subfamily)